MKVAVALFLFSFSFSFCFFPSLCCCCSFLLSFPCRLFLYSQLSGFIIGINFTHIFSDSNRISNHSGEEKKKKTGRKSVLILMSPDLTET